MSELTDRAIELLRERGWTIFQREDSAGHLCMLGALALAKDGRTSLAVDVTGLPEFSALCRAASERVGHVCAPSTYNDHHARDVDDVIHLLKEAGEIVDRDAELSHQ